MLKIVRAKLHCIRITGADLNYHGSISLDPVICEKAGILPLEFVNVWNKHTGARISTYVIYGEAGSRCCVLNGAAARTCQVGDEVIITAVEYVDRQKLYDFKPPVLVFGPGNIIERVFHYDVYKSKDRDFDFQITEDENEDED
ncbi:MAG: aspartate 1-decarboxylase [Rhodospirillales bacterium RIFCSPLOWO2_12_FULL_58_28]|nr:MAG: aspartate 1-decarboxylase [Rhodospirillales bacterium RIFCSPLOWO2_02_FULL_58_16]OHC77904.1 MAG: aspartate 1-decarboxylase [Rhodospirillales bacterium RIFCSPLOWO2_12_FULL_58_28]